MHVLYLPNRIDRDSTSRKFLGIRIGHANDSTLGRGIIGLSGIPNLSHDTGNIDDATGAFLGGHLEKGLCTVKDTTQVNVNDILPLGRLHAHDEGITRNTRIIDQDIDGTILFHGFGKELGNGVGFGRCVCGQ